jgi:cytochrome c biogenesis protein CcmG, thiol:disulfide interchange protein DsbE
VTRSAVTRSLFRAAAPLAALLLAGCTAEAKAPETPSPFAGCSALTAGSSPSSASRIVDAAAPPDLPDLRLPCFTGGAAVAVRDLRGPAVINLWASWCSPCRKELPVIQRLADQSGDRLTVLSVDTGDAREAGASFATDAGVSMPTLFDEDSKLLTALGGSNLPMTVFLDGAGRRQVSALPLDEAKLTDLVRTHTGVAVTR